MNANEFSQTTKRLLLAHQSAEEKFRLMPETDWSDEISNMYVRSLIALRTCPEEIIRQLAEAIDVCADPVTSTEEKFQTMREAEHRLLRLSFRIQDRRPNQIKSRLN